MQDAQDLLFCHERRERNEVERPDQPANDPVTALRSVPGFHWSNARLYALVDESRERNEVERPDQPAHDPVTALRSRLSLNMHMYC